MVFPVMAPICSPAARPWCLVVFASLTSTLDSLLASTADLLAEDVYFRLLRPQASDLQLKQAARLMVGGKSGAVLAAAGFAGLGAVLHRCPVASAVWPVACGRLAFAAVAQPSWRCSVEAWWAWPLTC